METHKKKVAAAFRERSFLRMSSMSLTLLLSLRLLLTPSPQLSLPSANHSRNNNKKSVNFHEKNDEKQFL